MLNLQSPSSSNPKTVLVSNVNNYYSSVVNFFISVYFKTYAKLRHK